MASPGCSVTPAGTSCARRRPQGEYPLAQALHAETLKLAERTSDAQQTGQALTNLGLIAYQAGGPDRAAGLHQQALERSEQLGDRRLAVVALGNLGLVAARRKNYPAAAQFHLRSLGLAESVGERRSVAEMLGNSPRWNRPRGTRRGPPPCSAPPRRSGRRSARPSPVPTRPG